MSRRLRRGSKRPRVFNACRHDLQDVMGGIWRIVSRRLRRGATRPCFFNTRECYLCVSSMGNGLICTVLGVRRTAGGLFA